MYFVLIISYSSFTTAIPFPKKMLPKERVTRHFELIYITSFQTKICCSKLKCDFVMFTFIAPYNTTWSTAHAYCIILWTFEDIARSTYVKTLANTTGTTSKYQRAMWPELYPKSIVFLCIVAWIYESVLSLSTCLRLWCRMLRRYQKHSKKRISTSNFKNLLLIIVTAKRWWCNMHVII